METRSRSLFRELGLATGLLAVLIVGVAGFAATSASGGFFRGSSHSDPERMRKHAEFAIEFALNEVDATPEQVARVKEVTRGLIDELEATHSQHEANREALIAEFKKPEISRETLQALRAQELALLDATSVKVVDAMVEAGAVLTPEQRADLIEWLGDFHHHR